jgi:hypothetical protein
VEDYEELVSEHVRADSMSGMNRRPSAMESDLDGIGKSPLSERRAMMAQLIKSLHLRTDDEGSVNPDSSKTKSLLSNIGRYVQAAGQRTPEVVLVWTAVWLAVLVRNSSLLSLSPSRLTKEM